MSEPQITLKQAINNNRNLLLDWLATLGASTVYVTYEGGGDSGDAESVLVEPPELESHLVSDCIALWQMQFSLETRQTSYTREENNPLPLGEALKVFALDWLEFAYPGWEINDGAQGVVTFKVAERRCELEHRQFYTECQVYEHAL